MQADAERVLGNLHILGVLSHNDKLMTNEDAFDIYVPTTFRGAMRSWYGERRGQNVTRIRSTVRGAIEFSQRQLTDIQAYVPTPVHDVNVNTLRHETMRLQFNRMIDGLCRSRKGLLNLIQTYRDDAALSSQIRLIDEEIGDFLEVMSRHSSEINLAHPGRTPGRKISESPPCRQIPLSFLDVALDDSGRIERL